MAHQAPETQAKPYTQPMHLGSAFAAEDCAQTKMASFAKSRAPHKPTLKQWLSALLPSLLKA